MSKRWIEAFRIDGKASRGIKPEHLAEVVDDDFGANPRALCFGHPKSDDPAAGTITGAKLDGNSLMVEVASLTKKAIDGIKSGEWINRSAAFFDPHHEANPRPGRWTLRHVGLLGGAAPGIPNMAPLSKALAFSADGDTLDNLEILGDPADALVYEGRPTPIHVVHEEEPPMTATPTPTPSDAEFAAREQRLNEREQAAQRREEAAAERVRNAFNASNGNAIDQLVRDGKVLPHEATGLKLAFAALDPEGAELEFGTTDKPSKATAAAHLLAFMAGLGKRAPLGERHSPSGEFAADAPKDGADAVARAEKMVAERPGLTFEAAMSEIDAAERAAR